MKLRVKIHLAIACALLVGALFFASDHFSRRAIVSDAQLLAHIDELQRLEARLDAEILKAGFLLYHDYDQSHLLLEQISKLGRKLDIRSVTAEYVCSRAVFDEVVAMGIDFSQGYYIGEPAPQLTTSPAA